MKNVYEIKPSVLQLAAKALGKIAAKNGKPITANPYNYTSARKNQVRAGWWERGWQEGQE